MQLRVKALYARTISIMITVAYVIEVIAVLSLGIASLAAIDVSPLVLSGMCNPTYLPRYAVLFWVPVITFEAFLFALALRIAYLNYLDIGDWKGAALLHIVLRDNFLFFVCAFVSYIVTARIWMAGKPQYFTIPGAFSCAFTTIMGCRLILNLCQAYYQPEGFDTTRPHTGSIWAAATKDVRFRRPQPRGAMDSISTSAWQAENGDTSIAFRSPITSDETDSSGKLPPLEDDSRYQNSHGTGGTVRLHTLTNSSRQTDSHTRATSRDQDEDSSMELRSFSSRIKGPSDGV